MRDNITPEEKLLRLIRGQKKQEKVVDKEFPPVIKEPKPAIRPLLNPLFHNYRNFLNIRKIIAAAFVASCIYLIISFVWPWVGLRKIKLPQVSEVKIIDEKIETKPQVKPYESYLEGIRGRQVFGTAAVPQTKAPANAISADLVKDINLVGIISGENPQAIIEDAKTHKTYYVTKGQFIGELQVEEIQEGKIVLNYQGQRYELYL